MNNPDGRISRSTRDSPRARRVILALAEGEVTEADYFDYWRRQNPNARVVIDLHTAGWVPLKRVGYARDLKRRQPRRNLDFDEIWCVFDVDAYPDVSRRSSRRQQCHGRSPSCRDRDRRLESLLRMAPRRHHPRRPAIRLATFRRCAQVGPRRSTDRREPALEQASQSLEGSICAGLRTYLAGQFTVDGGRSGELPLP